jgi:hypothetical protein
VCGTADHLQLHHRTYARLGRERLRDLILLCGDHHKFAHSCSWHVWKNASRIKRCAENLKIQHKPSRYNDSNGPVVSVILGTPTGEEPW